MSRFHFERQKIPAQAEDRFFRITSQNFPCLKALSLQDLNMEPGEARNAHIHPNAHQIDYVLSGRGRVGIVGPDGQQHLLDLAAGDAAFVPRGYLHWIENNGDSPAHFLLVVSHETPETIELADMIAGTPETVAGKTLG